MTRTPVATVYVVFALAATLGGSQPPAPGQPAGRWHRMEGTWSASGSRETLPTESGRPAAILQLSGAVVLVLSDGLSRGFRGDFIGFDDGNTIGVGRWVWTDERGDRIFGQLNGEPLQTGRRFVGVITGGTGRYAGITGEYAFTWQSVVEAEGVVQGRTSELKGRYRVGGGPR